LEVADVQNPKRKPKLKSTSSAQRKAEELVNRIRKKQNGPGRAARNSSRLDKAAVYEVAGRKGVRVFFHYRVWEAAVGEKPPQVTKVFKLKAQNRAHIAAHILEASTKAAEAAAGDEVEFQQIVRTWLKMRGNKLKPVVLDALTLDLKALAHKEGVKELINSKHQLKSRGLEGPDGQSGLFL
jgi:hypothetical protein